MSMPHKIVPGDTVLLTRRCLERRYLLRPDPTVNGVIEFCIAHAAARSGVEVHAICVLSNHLHIVLTDPRGAVSSFAQWLDRHVALCLNVYHQRRGVFWGPGEFFPVTLARPEDVLAKIVYTLSNPVKDGLVPHGDEWPGVRNRVEELGVLAKVVKRPDLYFSKKGKVVPEEATLRLTVPPGWSGVEEYQREVGEKLAAEEKHHRKLIGGNFLGAQQVKRASIDDRPLEPEPRGRLKPRIACQDTKLRVRLLAELREFRRRYREAYERYRQKERDVVFPFGTYWMRVQFQVACDPAPPT